jgi:hypothetical protein
MPGAFPVLRKTPTQKQKRGTMGSSTYPLNQFAPDYFGGLETPTKEVLGYEDKPYEYVYAPAGGQLTANQVVGKDQVDIQPDADFMMDAWYISLFTGAFQIQLTDATGYQLSSGFINSGALSQSSADPTVFSPSHPFPASGKIQVAITDLSGFTNPVQIVFKGRKRFRVNR